jgi:hypothetical protein
MPLRAQPPQGCASANFATSALETTRTSFLVPQASVFAGRCWCAVLDENRARRVDASKAFDEQKKRRYGASVSVTYRQFEHAMHGLVLELRL